MARFLEPTYNDFPPLDTSGVVLSLKSFKEFCKRSYVYDDVGIPIPFILNPAQEKFCEFVIENLKPLINKRDGRAYHIVIHKSRQQGITTVCLKLEQWLQTVRDKINILHVMPTEDEARELCQLKAQPLFEATHPTLLAKIRPSGLHFDFVSQPVTNKPLGGRLAFMSAGTKGSARGRTFQVLIQDEYAAYQNPYVHEAGILPAMEKASFPTLRVVIFTAQGMNHAYDLVKAAKQTDSDWDFLFLPWYIMPQYEMEPTGKYKDLTDLDEYEKFLLEEFEKNDVPPHLWARKLTWYSYTLRNVAKNDQKYMFESYPTTSEESFQSTGSPIFDSVKLYSWMDKPFKRYDAFEVNGKTEFQETPEGSFRVFQEPQRGHRYVIGVDQSDGGENGDNSAVRVFDILPGKVRAVAVYTGKVDQETLADLAVDLAVWYNHAMIVPERNKGQVFIKWVVDVKRYARIYAPAPAKSLNGIGIYTTNEVKNEAISRLRFLINNDYYEDFDPEFIQEALHFAWKRTQNGMMKAEGTSGYTDDSVAASLMMAASLNMRLFRGWDELLTNKKRKKY